jgi:FSR family fosmidomycin resistance protein-like MFS transporter
MASGLSVGLAMGLGGIAAIALGAVADAVDLETALYVGACAPAFGAVVCLLLPPPMSLAAVAPEPAAAAIV